MYKSYLFQVDKMQDVLHVLPASIILIFGMKLSIWEARQHIKWLFKG